MKPFILSLLFPLICLVAISQNITGSWQGVLLANGKNVRLLFNVTGSTGAYTTTFDSLDLNAFELKCSKNTFITESRILGIAMIQGGFRGKWNGDDGITHIFF